MSEQEYYECSVCCHSTTSETKAAKHASTYVAAATAEVNKVIERMTEPVVTQVWIWDREPAATENGLPGIGHWEKI